VIEVSGNDRTRWLQGMVSNDVERLEAGTTRSGCYATLLTPKGRIVADLQVMLRGDLYWLDLARDAVSTVLERLDRYVIADDIALADRSAAIERLGLEGPAALEIFAAAADNAPRLGRDACAEVRIAGADVLVAAFGWTGEAAVQIFAPAQAGDVIAEAIAVAGADRGLVTGDFEVLETLRIEAGIPRLGAELDESVLPAEAGLDRAVATDKGCFTGQEVVERLRTQGSVSHRLIGISVDGDEPLAVGAQVFANGKRVGEVTSACTSPVAGAIALAFVRRAHAEPGSQVEIGDRKGRVASLPFAAEGAPH
jgi:aminomethyltransferase